MRADHEKIGLIVIVLAVPSLFWLAATLARWWTTALVTDRRLLYRSGWTMGIVEEVALKEIISLEGSSWLKLRTADGQRLTLEDVSAAKASEALAEATGLPRPRLFGHLVHLYWSGFLIAFVAMLPLFRFWFERGLLSHGSLTGAIAVWIAAFLVYLLAVALGMAALRPWTSASTVAHWLDWLTAGKFGNSLLRWLLAPLRLWARVLYGPSLPPPTSPANGHPVNRTF